MSDCTFFQASTVARCFLVVSEPWPVLMHWDQSAGPRGKGRHCGGRDCYLCREGLKAEIRTLLRLEDEQQDHWLFEARPRLRFACEEIASRQAHHLTVEVSIFRQAGFQNSPVEIEVLGAAAYGAFYDLSRLVESTYLPPILDSRVMDTIHEPSPPVFAAPRIPD